MVVLAAPSLSLLGSTPNIVEALDEYHEDGFRAVDVIDGDLTGLVSSTLEVDTSAVGHGSATYTVQNTAGLSATVVRTITVVDTVDGCAGSPCAHGTCTDTVGGFRCACEPLYMGSLCDTERPLPSISVLSPKPIVVEAGTVWKPPTVTAFDAVDGDLSQHVVVSGDVNTLILATPQPVVFSVVNSAGQRGAAHVSVTVRDTIDGCTTSPCVHGLCTDAIAGFVCVCEPLWMGKKCNDTHEGPMVTLLGDSPVVVEAGEPYVDAGATAHDKVDGNLTSSIHINASAVNVDVPGTYTVTYAVDCSYGLSAHGSRTVNVVDSQDDCADNPCAHGSCVDMVGTFHCICSDLYRGTLCEVSRAADITMSLTGGSAIQHEAGFDFVDPGFSATDTIDGDLTGDVEVSGSVDVRELGDNVLTYSVANSGTAMNSVTRVVTVVDTVDGCLDSGCSHGECSDIIGGYVCTCDVRWTGPNCNVQRSGGMCFVLVMC